MLAPRNIGGDQQLLSVLMATAPAGPCAPADSADATITNEQLADLDLHRDLSNLGVRLEVLADGSLAAALRHTGGAATDHAALAVRCALLIKARWPAVTIALGTGTGFARERAPAGEVFDRTAALLCDHAGAPSSEQILLDEATRGLLEVRYVVHQTPTGAYALTGEELALDASRPLLGKPTRCVGRDMELGMLESMLAGCVEDAQPRAVVMTGPPGSGKSRLRHELLRRIDASGNDVLILIGRGDPMSAGSSCSLLGQALRRLCGILDGENLDARRGKLALRVGRHIPADARQRVVAFLGELSGVSFPDADNVKLRAARHDPLLMSDQLTQAVLDFLRAECAEHPVLLVLEDLHWGDALTVKLVETALRDLKASPLMVLALARPEVDESFPRLWPNAAQVATLRPLGRKAGERLVQHVLGKQVPRDTVERIVEQSEGNALFLEELIRTVAEGRDGEAPKTVLAMLQARIGRLDAGTRWFLRAASVFGETCWRGGIRALLGGAMSDRELSSLLEEEILEERRESRFPGEHEYRFRHALMHDAAYGMLAEPDRVALHRVAGEYLQALGEPDPLVLAEHFLQGKQPSRAIPYFIQAAEQSYDASHMGATRLAAERGLACGAQGEQRGALLSSQIHAYAGRAQFADVLALGTEALQLLPENSRRWCRAMQAMFPAAMLSGQEALLADIGARFARVEPDPDARVEYVGAAVVLAWTLAITGKKEASRTLLERARQVGVALGRSELLAWGYIKALEASYCLFTDEAPWSVLTCYAESREALRIAGEQRLRVMASATYGKTLYELGDPADAETDLRETFALAERLNETFSLAYAKTILARQLARQAPLDRLDEAARLARDVIATNNVTLISLAYGILAEIARRQGDLATAEQQARAACEASCAFPTFAWDLIAIRARILLQQGRAEAALATAEQGVADLERLGLGGWGEIALRLALAEARHAVGTTEAAHAALQKAVERLRARLDDIPHAAVRERYLTQVPVNARVLALARQWLGIELLG